MLLLYIQPFQYQQDFDVDAAEWVGLYPVEQNDRYAYAYTQGDATLMIPYTGTGWFATDLHMAGPNGTVPASASLVANNIAINVGPVTNERVFHVLLPTTEHGDTEVTIRSTTARTPGDRRELGLLLDRVSIRSLGLTTPPQSILVQLVAALCIVWAGTLFLPVATGWQLGLLLCVGMILGIELAFLRGQQPPSSWSFLGATAIVALLITLGSLLFAHRPHAVADRLPLSRFKRRFEQSRLGTAILVVTPIYFVWRLALWVIAAFGLRYNRIAYLFDPHWIRGELIDGRVLWYEGGSARLQYLRSALLDSWLHWDGRRYMTIAVNAGYEYGVLQPNIAFFPLYPILTRGAMIFTGGNEVLAGLIVSQIALYGGMLLLYDLVAVDFNSSVARRTLLAMLLFPASVFLAAIYTESLAIALAVAAVWAIRRERWWLAGLAGFLLALCRFPGFMIAPVIMLSYLHHHQWQWRSVFRPTFLACLLPALGLGLFMLYQWYTFRTPIAFLIAQKDWNNRTSPPWVLPLAMWRALSTSPNQPLEVLQLTTWIGFIGLAFLAVRWLPLPYILTMLFLLLPPYLSSWHRSFSRYVLPAFPAFIVIAMLCERRTIRNVLLVATLPFLIGAVVLFVNDFWMG